MAETLQPTIVLNHLHQQQEFELEEPVITDLDRDLTPTHGDDVKSLRPSQKEKPNGDYTAISQNSPAVVGINAEWRRLKAEHESRQSSAGGDATAAADRAGQTDSLSAVVVSSQPRRLSEMDVILQPSEVEKLLEQNSLFSRNGSAGTNNKASTSAGPAEAQGKSNSTSSTASSVFAMEEHKNSYQPSPPTTTRRNILLDGFKTCLTPVFGFLRKEKKPLLEKKKENWEVPFADIRELEFIGSGSQGAVFVGEYLGEKIAVKKVKDVVHCEEAKHLRKLNHPNVVRFK